MHWVKGKGVLEHCDPDRFAEFCKYWDRDETKAVAKRSYINRNIDQDGLGITTHNNGAQKFEQIACIMTSQMGEERDLWTLFEKTHIHKGMKKVEEKKAREVLETFKQKRDELLTQHS